MFIEEMQDYLNEQIFEFWGNMEQNHDYLTFLEICVTLPKSFQIVGADIDFRPMLSEMWGR